MESKHERDACDHPKSAAYLPQLLKPGASTVSAAGSGETLLPARVRIHDRLGLQPVANVLRRCQLQCDLACRDPRVQAHFRLTSLCWSCRR